MVNFNTTPRPIKAEVRGREKEAGRRGEKGGGKAGGEERSKGTAFSDPNPPFFVLLCDPRARPCWHFSFASWLAVSLCLQRALGRHCKAIALGSSCPSWFRSECLFFFLINVKGPALVYLHILASFSATQQVSLMDEFCPHFWKFLHHPQGGVSLTTISSPKRSVHPRGLL